jgi:hypothetical protein
MTEDHEAIVIISEGKSEKSIPHDKERMKKALTEYKAKYPDDNVSLDDFRYVGIVAGSDINDTKDELIRAIEGKYII